MYNLDGKGRRDYLSVGETELDTLYWVRATAAQSDSSQVANHAHPLTLPAIQVMFALFTAITAAWVAYVWKNREHAQRIHYLMGLLGLFKALTLLSQAIMTEHIEATGHADGWNIAYYIFTFFRGILFFTVIVLIGTGWSYMKV